jgi:ABC-type oligopeptide transport system substrate-binding subunit
MKDLTVREALQMAVDYYTLNSTDFENKYPISPPPKDVNGFTIPGWVEWAKKALASGDSR